MKRFLPLVLLFVLASALFYEAYADTPTYDEPANMAASFDYVYRGDFRIYPDNPPLVKYLAGLALFPIHKQMNFPYQLEIYQNPAKFNLYAFGRDFLYESGNNAKLIIFLTRLPNILFTLVLGILLYFFAKDLYGEKGGLLALFLYALDPNIRGHGHILAFDLPLTFFIVLILFMTSKLIKYPEKKLLLIPLISLLFGLGFLTKFTFIFFAIIYFVGMISYILIRRNFIPLYLKTGDARRGAPSAPQSRAKSRGSTHWGCRAAGPVNYDKKQDSLIKIINFSLIIFATSFLSLWLFGLSTNYNKKTLDYDRVPIIASANQQLKDDFKWNLFQTLPVPYYYKVGLQTMYAHNIVSQPAYLLGEVHAKNDWFFYFPISFLLKTPIPILFFIILTVFLLARNRIYATCHCEEPRFNRGDEAISRVCELEQVKRLPRLASRARNDKLNQNLMRNSFPFILGFAFMLFMMLFSHINNVYRYLFPSLVLFILGSSQIVNLITNKAGDSREGIPSEAPLSGASFGNPERQDPRRYGILVIIMVYLALTSIFSFPLDLSYTNEFTGIPPAGYKYLSDSEIDWGQDLERLGKWLKDHREDQQTITLSYLGTAEPSYYGIKYKALKFDDLSHLSGIVAISVGNLTLGDWQWRSQLDYQLGVLKAPLDFLRAKKPDAVIGKSIFVYKF